MHVMTWQSMAVHLFCLNAAHAIASHWNGNPPHSFLIRPCVRVWVCNSTSYLLFPRNIYESASKMGNQIKSILYHPRPITSPSFCVIPLKNTAQYLHGRNSHLREFTLSLSAQFFCVTHCLNNNNNLFWNAYDYLSIYPSIFFTKLLL